MASNLPPGCSNADIPGCRPEDSAIDKLIDERNCLACLWLDVKEDDGVPCCEHCKDKADFESPYDLSIIADRLQALAEALEEGYIDWVRWVKSSEK